MKTLIELAEKKKITNGVLAAYVNNKLRPLDYEYKKNDKIEFVDISNEDGKKIYQRGLLFVFYIALKKLFPNKKMNVQHSLSKGIYITFEPSGITNEQIALIKEEMKLIIDKKFTFDKKETDLESCINVFEKEGLDFKKEILNYKKDDKCTYYDCMGYSHYFYGQMPLNTGYVKVFNLINYEPGVILMPPSADNPDRVPTFSEQAKIHEAHMETENWGNIMRVSTTSELNKTIEEGRIKDLIEVQEALQEKKISDIALDIVKRKKRIVLVSGPSSSGKTTFTHRLKVYLQALGIFAKTVSLDNYFVNRDKTPLDENGDLDYESLKAMNLKKLNSDIGKLLDGEEIYMPEFDFQKGLRNDKAYKMKLNKDEVIIFEGIHAINNKLTPDIYNKDKYKIYVSALTQLNLDRHNRIQTTDNRLIRRIVRDARTRGHNAEDTLNMWESVRKGERKHIFPFQENADSIFNSALCYELAVLKKYALPLLDKITSKSEAYPQAIRLKKFLLYFESIDDDSIIPSTSILKEFTGG